MKDFGRLCSRTWSELQSVGVNVSFLVEHDAFTNRADEIFPVLPHKLRPVDSALTVLLLAHPLLASSDLMPRTFYSLFLA